MYRRFDPATLSGFRTFAQACALAVGIIGCLGLAGWLFDSPRLKSVYLGFATMKANTALAFVLSGVSLWLSSKTDPLFTRSALEQVVAGGCAIAVALVGFLTLAEYVAGVDFGFDQWLIVDTAVRPNTYPGRMAASTAVNFGLFGISLLLLGTEARIRLVEFSAIVPGLVALFAFAGYLHGATVLYRIPFYGSMALHTTVGFLLLCAGILASRPDRGLIAVLTSEGAGSVAARRLLPAVFALSFAFGWLGVLGYRAGFYDQALASAVSLIANVVLIGLLIGWGARIQNRLELARQLAQARFRQVVESAPNGVLVVDRQGAIVLVNPQTERLFGYRSDELLGRPVEMLVPEAARDRHRVHRQTFHATPIARYMGTGQALSGLRKDGSEFPVEIGLSPMQTEEGLQVLGIIIDVTERKRAEEALFEEKERAQITLASIGDAVITTDADGRVESLNRMAEQLTGWSQAEAEGLPVVDVFRLLTEANREPVENPVWECLRLKQTVGFGSPVVLITKSGREIAIDDSASPIRDRDGDIVGAVVVFRDVTEQRQFVQQVSHQATHDALTGLVNRREFERRLELMLVHAAKWSRPHALCYLDLDQFKVVNDACGHAAGDELLRQLASLLEARIRKRDTLARLGGDEFGLLLGECTLEQASQIAEQLREAVEEFRFLWEDKVFCVGVSIGLVPVTKRSGDIQDVMSAADRVCYAAKQAGRNRVVVHHPKDTESEHGAGDFEGVGWLQQALSEERFVLYDQPIVTLGGHSSEVLYREVLLRMRTRDGRTLTPGAFIPAAERGRQMLAVDQWVVSNVVSVLRGMGTGPISGRFAINLSGQSLTDKGFLDFVIQQCQWAGIAPEQICFEVSETSAIAHLNATTRFMASLRELGCQFALDRFGSGLSSFAYLKNLTVDYLKIDGGLVRDIVHDPVDYALVEAIHRIGHVMGIKTIAESVENDAILEKLGQIGVDYAQGYALARPAPLNGAHERADALMRRQ